MPLYSTDTLSKADGSTFADEPCTTGPKGKDVPEHVSGTPWCYIFARRAKVEWITEKLSREFGVFIHRSIVYKKKENHIKKKEQPTISGLVFIQGAVHAVQAFLDRCFSGLYLVKDCSTGLPAVIPDRVMQPFMQIAGLSPNRVRFMPHPFGYYSSGHVLVRITSGPLAGLEGYQVRISRDKCLVTSMGGMTVAIGGVCKETFENVEEYIHLRREQQEVKHGMAEMLECGRVADIAGCFCDIENELDVLAVAKSMDCWIQKAEYMSLAGNAGCAAEILVAVIKETAHRLEGLGGRLRTKPLTDVCHEAAKCLLALAEDDALSEELGEQVIAQRKELLARYPFLADGGKY